MTNFGSAAADKYVSATLSFVLTGPKVFLQILSTYIFFCSTVPLRTTKNTTINTFQGNLSWAKWLSINETRQEKNKTTKKSGHSMTTTATNYTTKQYIPAFWRQLLPRIRLSGLPPRTANKGCMRQRMLVAKTTTPKAIQNDPKSCGT